MDLADVLEQPPVNQLYDQIGQRYRWFRRPDARLEAVIDRALGRARSVVNVGAGTGSYEPRGRRVLAVEPSLTMIGQRPDDAAPVVRAAAAELPFADASFDAAMAVLTVHHWDDLGRGLSEMRRISRQRIVIVTWDPAAAGFWLTGYFPEILEIDRRVFPTLSELRRHLGEITVSPLPIPHDCNDGFLGAYWRRPYAYFDPELRRAISTFSRISDLEKGLRRLRRDLETGLWFRRHGQLIRETDLDLGYRLVVARI